MDHHLRLWREPPLRCISWSRGGLCSWMLPTFRKFLGTERIEIKRSCRMHQKAKTGVMGLPVSRCHKVLTLQNVLLYYNSLKHIISFKDDLVESPLMNLEVLNQRITMTWYGYLPCLIHHLRHCTLDPFVITTWIITCVVEDAWTR